MKLFLLLSILMVTVKLALSKESNDMDDEDDFIETNSNKVKTNIVASIQNINNVKTKKNLKSQPQLESNKQYMRFAQTEQPQGKTQVNKEKEEIFKANVMGNLQSTKTYFSSGPEGFIEKFQKTKYVKSGQDTFLGFLKYMSNTAKSVAKKYERESKEKAGIR